MSKSKLRSKLLTLLNLLLVGLFPMVSFVYVLVKTITYFFDVYAPFLSPSPFFLMFCILQSHLLKYCKYHRGMMYGLLFADLSYYIMSFCQSILTYNILVLSCIFVSLLCFIKTIQIIITYYTTRNLFKSDRRTA